MNTTYISRTDQVFAASGPTIPLDDRSVMAVAANRACNMAGGRYSDNLRSEIARYQAVGREFYMAEQERSTTIVRNLGY